MPVVEKHIILLGTLFVMHVIFAFGVVRMTGQVEKRETWIKPSSPVNFGHLTLWKELRSDSEIDCVRKCYHAYCSGCGYQTDEEKCLLYLDWDNGTSWTPLLTCDYYVPASSIVLEGWSDLRKYGQSFAILIVTKVASWSEANTFCINKGGTLFIMNTNERRQAVMDEFQRKGKTRGRYWIGLTDREVEGDWYWLDGSPGQSPDFFLANQPSNSGNNEHCGALKIKVFLINDNNCAREIKSICEIQLVP